MMVCPGDRFPYRSEFAEATYAISSSSSSRSRSKSPAFLWILPPRRSIAPFASRPRLCMARPVFSLTLPFNSLPRPLIWSFVLLLMNEVNIGERAQNWGVHCKFFACSRLRAIDTPFSMRSAETEYNEVAYPSAIYPQTHPDRLATIGRLFGLSPAPVEKARVLELGCGDSANLTAMADILRHAHITGIDLASAPVQRGREVLKALNISNVDLQVGDI